MRPAEWNGRVPKRVLMNQSVTVDQPLLAIMQREKEPIPVCEEDETYEVRVNQHGAVTALTEHGELGLKPNEFSIVEWH